MSLKVIASVFLVITSSAFAVKPSPQSEESSDEPQMRSSSPNGRYAMLVTRDPDGEMEKERIELIELPAKRVLLVLSDPEYMPDLPTRDATLHWSKDSQRVTFSRGAARRHDNDLRACWRWLR